MVVLTGRAKLSQATAAATAKGRCAGCGAVGWPGPRATAKQRRARSRQPRRARSRRGDRSDDDHLDPHARYGLDAALQHHLSVVGVIAIESPQQLMPNAADRQLRHHLQQLQRAAVVVGALDVVHRNYESRSRGTTIVAPSRRKDLVKRIPRKLLHITAIARVQSPADRSCGRRECKRQIAYRRSDDVCTRRVVQTSPLAQVTHRLAALECADIDGEVRIDEIGTCRRHDNFGAPGRPQKLVELLGPRCVVEDQEALTISGGQMLAQSTG